MSARPPSCSSPGRRSLAAWTLGLLHRGRLPATYAATVVALALLYPLCDRYRGYEQAHPDGWPRYV